MKLALMLVLAGCGGNTWTASDTTAATHAVQLAEGCELLCLSDAGCKAEQAAACFDAIGCNMGSALHRHGAPDLGTGDAGCK
jgi:hypothetical protein